MTAEIYAIDVSPDLISEVTDAVVAEVTAWQARPLEPNPQQPRGGRLARPQDAGGGPAGDLHGRLRRGGERRRGRVRAGRLGASLSDDRQDVAPGVGARHPVLCVSAGRAARDLHVLERVHARVRTIIKTRGHFPTDEAATKLIWLALRNITAGWSKAAQHWRASMNQFAILYGDRFLKGPVT
jgi:transposase-like protein